MDDLSGFWGGRYSYRRAGYEPVPYDAELTQDGSTVSGLTTEANTFLEDGPSLLVASISGTVQGNTIRFLKTYHPQSGGHSIRYKGTISENGTLIVGEWTAGLFFKGYFEMRRDAELSVRQTKRQEEPATVE